MSLPDELIIYCLNFLCDKDLLIKDSLSDKVNLFRKKCNILKIYNLTCCLEHDNLELINCIKTLIKAKKQWIQNGKFINSINFSSSESFKLGFPFLHNFGNISYFTNTGVFYKNPNYQVSEFRGFYSLGI